MPSTARRLAMPSRFQLAKIGSKNAPGVAQQRRTVRAQRGKVVPNRRAMEEDDRALLRRELGDEHVREIVGRLDLFWLFDPPPKAAMPSRFQLAKIGSKNGS